MATKDEDAVTQLFVASTHAPVLFFSSAGKVYRLKVWKLPESSPQAKGRSMANLLPLAPGETIAAVLALPENEAEWASLHVMFATAHGYVRRNAMDAFANVPTRGKLAMLFEDGDADRLIGVQLCEETDDVLLAARSGKAIRFAATDVREFQSRTSSGVRGMTLAAGDEVISLSILHGVDATPEELSAADALGNAGLEPVELREKEGLALINGTDGMLGMLLLAIQDLTLLAKTADLGAAMSVEATLGTDRVFAADLQALRPHPGQADSAQNLLSLLRNSPIVASHRVDCAFVQDAYSLRCAPQVAGAFRDTLAHAELVADRELASAIDNPVVTDDGRVESNGNFHGAPIGYVLDFLAIAIADLASMSERRTDRLLDVARSRGLPPFLADDPGVDSGHMIAQYTQAALVSELKRLAVPASVDSIPSSAMQEDHVSMGWSGGAQIAAGSVDGTDQGSRDRDSHRSKGSWTCAHPSLPAPGTGCRRCRLAVPALQGPGRRPVAVAGDRDRCRSSLAAMLWLPLSNAPSVHSPEPAAQPARPTDQGELS